MKHPCLHIHFIYMHERITCNYRSMHKAKSFETKKILIPNLS